MAGSHVDGGLAVVGRQIRTGAGFQEHQSAPVAIRDPGGYVKGRLAKLATSDVHLRTVTQEGLDNGRLRAFHGYVQRRVVVVRRSVDLSRGFGY